MRSRHAADVVFLLFFLSGGTFHRCKEGEGRN